MQYFIENTSFATLIVIVIALIILCIYAFFDIEKKKPGHPARYIMPCSLPIITSIIINKYFYEKYGEVNLFSNIYTFMAVLIFYISFVVTFILSHKKGYTNSKLFEQNKFLLIVLAVLFGVAVIFLGVDLF